MVVKYVIRRSSRQKSLIIHKPICSGDRPYACDLCNKALGSAI